MTELWNDLRVAARSLARARGFTAAAIVTLGLGMGAGTAVYTLLDRVVLEPLRYPDAGLLVRLRNQVPGVGPDESWNMAAAQYFHFRERVPALAAIGAWRRSGVNVPGVDGGAARRASAAIVTAALPAMLGARAELGRLLDAGDDVPGAPRVTVLSHDFWRAHFGGDRGVLGRTMLLDENPVTIVGVMASGTELPEEPGAPAQGTDLWLAMRLNPAGPFHNNHVIPMIARLAAGATAGQAQEQIARLTPRLPEVFPNVYSQEFFDRYGFRTVVVPLRDDVLGTMGRHLWILFGAVCLVLLVAAANVMNLLLVRLEARRRDVAIRVALGAGRRSLARLSLAEGLLLSLGGGVLAMGVAAIGTRALVALAPPAVPRLHDVRLDGSVLGFAALLVVIVTAALSAVPLLPLRAAGSLPVLGDGGRGATAGRERRRLRGTLVAGQVALALMLVVGSALLLRSFQRLRAVDPGVDAHGVLTVQLYLPYQRYDSLPKVWRFQSDVLARVRALPGVSAAGLSIGVPFHDDYGCTVQGFEDAAVFERLRASDLTSCAGQLPTSPGYFESLRIPLLSGRLFSDSDNDAPGAGAVIVSKAFAERFWPGEDPLGKGVKPNGQRGAPYYRVVGMVGDVYGAALDQPPAIAIYYPVVAIPGTGRWYPSEWSLTVRTALADPMAALSLVRQAVAEVDPSIPLANAEALTTARDRSMGRLSFSLMLLAVAGAVALALATVGVYGVTSYVVARRTGEMGVRLALGARPAQVERLVVGESLRLSAVGIAAGLAGSLLGARLLSGLLYGVAPTDPTAFAAAALVLAGVAAAAAFLPARRAGRVDPATALRSE